MALTIRDEVKSLKRDKILDVSARLFFDRGYHGTSIESICSELGVTKPFIYYHFTRKDDILQALYQSSIDAALEIAERSRDGDPSPLHQLAAFVADYARLLTSEFQPRIALISREKGLLSKEMMRDINAAKLRFLHIVTGIISAGAEAGEFVVDDAQIAAQGVLGMLNWIINWYRLDGPLKQEALTRRMVNLALRSLGVPVEAASG